MRAAASRALKLALTGVLYRLGLCGLWRRLNDLRGRRVTIVTFHRVGDAPADNSALPTMFLSPARFERTLEHLCRRYRVISLDELAEMRARGRRPPAGALVITFDDGYRDVFRNAVPALQRRGLPATVFLPTGCIGRADAPFWWDRLYAALHRSRPDEIARGVRDPDLARDLRAVAGDADPARRERVVLDLIDRLQGWPEDRLRAALDDVWRSENDAGLEGNRVADWAEVEDGLRHGVSYGSHTVRHLFLDAQPPEVVRDELRESRRAIEERLGTPATAIAYPGGRISASVIDEARAAGYRLGLTTRPGVNGDGDDPLALRRINLWDGSVRGISGRFSEALLASVLLDLPLLRWKRSRSRGRGAARARAAASRVDDRSGATPLSAGGAGG